MLCQHCNEKPFSVQLKTSVNGISAVVYLCADCYKKMLGGGYVPHGKSLVDVLFEGGKSFVPAERCEVCGTSYDDYERDGVLGCACCYDAFKEQLMPVIARIHGKTTHVGRVNKNYNEHDLQRELAVLQEKLENAVREKKFTLAGKINSRIEKIKKRINEGGGYGN